jgi:enediyne biosynthesis protein E4
VKGNRQAIGARVVLKSGSRTYVQEIQAGASYLSQNDLRLHFGLGAGKIDAIEVRWSNGDVETIADVASNRIVTITQGKGVTAIAEYRAKTRP